MSTEASVPAPADSGVPPAAAGAGGGAAAFALRIAVLDYYMAPPRPEVDICWSEFHGCGVERVPVVRIYGSTPAGQKACLHLHRVSRSVSACLHGAATSCRSSRSSLEEICVTGCHADAPCAAG
jgi:hypothetical protein